MDLTSKRASPFSSQIHRTSWLSLPAKVVVAEQKSEKTVRNQITVALGKVGVRSRSELIVKVLSDGYDIRPKGLPINDLQQGHPPHAGFSSVWLIAPIDHRWEQHMYSNIEFASEGATLQGRHYHSAGNARPTVIMAHGTSATITMAIDRYAEAIFEAGFDVLLYDHRNFGLSGGEPRQEINPWVQARGYRDAVAFLRESLQADRVALWGDSYAGGLVLVAGALIEDVSAVVAQIPSCGATWPQGPTEGTAFDTLRDLFESADVRGEPADVAGSMPVVSLDQINAPSLLAPPQAFRWFLEYGGRRGSGWENKATRVIPKTPVPCSPLIAAPHLNMPVLMMNGRNDEMLHCNPELQNAVFDRIAGPKEKVIIYGGHFGLLWEDSPNFLKAINTQIEFLKRCRFLGRHAWTFV